MSLVPHQKTLEVADLRSSLERISKDIKQPRNIRDIIAIALVLTGNFNQDDPSERETMKKVFNFVLASLKHKEHLQNSSQTLQALIDDNCTAEEVDTTIDDAMDNLAGLGLTPYDARATRIASSSRSSVVTFPTSRKLVSQEMTTTHDARIFIEGADSTVKVNKDATDRRTWGHQIIVSQRRKELPSGNFSVHDTQKNMTFDFNGQVDYQVGSTIQFK